MSTIKLKWLNLNTSGQGYNIYRSDSSMDVATLPAVYATIDTTNSFYVDTNVNFGETWYYIVSSIDSEGNETFSTEYKVLCKENIYCLAGDGVLSKYSFDMDLQWKNYENVGRAPSIVDYTTNDKIFYNCAGRGITISTNGIPEHIFNISPTGHTRLLTDGKILNIRYNGNSSSTARLYYIFNSDGSVHYSRSGMPYRVGGLGSQEDKQWIFIPSGSGFVVRDFTFADNIWSNTYIGSSALHVTCDTLGFATVSDNTGNIYKFYIDTTNYAEGDPPIWEDLTTFNGKNIVDIFNDRQGNVVICSDDGQVVKYDTNNDITFQVNINKSINDFRIQYDGDILICTDDSYLLRLDSVDGTTKFEKLLDDTIKKLAIEPGIGHIQNGSILSFD